MCRPMNFLRRAVAFTVLVAALSAERAAALEVVVLNVADAADIITIIDPLLTEEESVSGAGDKLILDATPERIAELRRIVDRFDRVPQRLRITVRQGAGDVRALSGTRTTGRVTVDDGSVSSRTRIQVYSTRQANDRRSEQFVWAVEGRPATISVGTEYPVVFRQLFPSFGGAQAVEGLDYRYAGSGFDVIPRVSGGRVTLEISPHLDDPPARGSGPVRRRGLATTVSGRLGEWIPLGGSLDEAERDDARIIARTRKLSDSDYRVFVRVDSDPG